MEGVDEATLPHFHGLLDELVDCIDGVVLLIEDLGGRRGTFSSF